MQTIYIAKVPADTKFKRELFGPFKTPEEARKGIQADADEVYAILGGDQFAFQSTCDGGEDVGIDSWKELEIGVTSDTGSLHVMVSYVMVELPGAVH